MDSGLLRLFIVVSFAAFAGSFFVGSLASAHGTHFADKKNWVKISAKDKFERSAIVDLGLSIEFTGDDYVAVLASDKELAMLQEKQKVLLNFETNPEIFDFPTQDSNFHNYSEVLTDIRALSEQNRDIVRTQVIGKSHQGRDIVAIKISTDPDASGTKPGIVFMGTHHAREHVSTEIPLMLAQYLVTQYHQGNQRIVDLVQSREINIIPLVNPDGTEWDIASGRYRSWRKNRATNAGGPVGVDLNRNYGHMWGTGGSSTDPSSDVYMGTAPFSEPETRAIRDFVDTRQNLTILLSFHTFSELILYPWGHKYDSIEDARDLQVHSKMAQKMAQWNHYTPQQSSDLYIASGDTTDWSYGVHRIISFTFELDPKGGLFGGGFYPGQAVLPTVFNKNLEPCLYLIGYADNPYRVLEPGGNTYGLQTNFLD